MAEGNEMLELIVVVIAFFVPISFMVGYGLFIRHIIKLHENRMEEHQGFTREYRDR